ncbi:MAG TPA: PEGA domain-containing protein [Vicinamibacterales bacterium]|nr:PEGA domain-containing protein [Vicinamibacterales bacterium]
MGRQMQMCAGTASRIRTLALTLALVCAGAAGPTAAAQDPAQGEELLAEATRLFDELDYERAVPVLDSAIAALQARVNENDSARASFVRALELRGRARFGLNDLEGASSDFRLLLEIEPGFTFDPQVSPRVVALLDSVRKTTVGTLQLSVSPSDAIVQVEGRRFPASGAPIPVRAGDLELTITRVGYQPVSQRITIKPSATTEISVSLERVSPAVFIVTSPPGVEVAIGGSSHGRTEAGPLPPDYESIPGRLGVPPEQVSRPLVITDVTPGVHKVTFSRECYVTQERTVAIEGLADYRIEPVQLAPAVGTLTIESIPAGARVFVDGEARGEAPVTLTDVCAGSRRVELRSPQGRAAREVTLEPGQTVAVKEEVKPTFALLPSAEAPSPGLPDNRTRVERALASSRQVGLYIPTDAELEKAMEGQPLPADWLAFDASGQPVGAAASFSPAARRELSERIARALDVQGVGAVSQPTAGSSELVVSLLAAGGGHPDVVPLIPERVDSVTDALERFDYLPPLFRREIGAVAVEVLDTTGLVVASVGKDGPAARAGLAVGETIVTVDGQPVATAADFERLLESRAAGDQISLGVKDAKGASRTVPVTVRTTPRLVSVSDRTLLFNSLAVALRTRLASADPTDEPFIRLNLAVALIRLGDYEGAREQLMAVNLPAGPGISLGTQQYLLGLVHEGLGDVASAEQAWRAAAAAGGSLTEEGPAIAPLVNAKLNRAP